MQIHKLLKKNKKKKAFTLLEIMFALGILSIIAIFIFPSLANLSKNAKINKNQARVIFAMEEAIESSRNKDIQANFTYEVNEIDIDVSINQYDGNSDFKEIVARCGDKELRLVVEKWEGKKLLLY